EASHRTSKRRSAPAALVYSLGGTPPSLGAPESSLDSMIRWISTTYATPPLSERSGAAPRSSAVVQGVHDGEEVAHVVEVDRHEVRQLSGLRLAARRLVEEERVVVDHLREPAGRERRGEEVVEDEDRVVA